MPERAHDQPGTPPDVGHIDAKSLHKAIDADQSILLLDVREPVERAICVIPTVRATTELAIPMGQIVAALDDIRENAKAVQGPLVVYCHHGVRSLAVGRWLLAQGVTNVVNLTGGIDGYAIEADRRIRRY